MKDDIKSQLAELRPITSPHSILRGNSQLGWLTYLVLQMTDEHWICASKWDEDKEYHIDKFPRRLVQNEVLDWTTSIWEDETGIVDDFKMADWVKELIKTFDTKYFVLLSNPS